MKRPGLVTGVALAHLLLALVLLALSLFLLLQTRSPEVNGEPDAADDIQGLRLAAGILGVPGLLILAAFAGLWRGKRWGWSLVVLIDACIAGVFVYVLIDDGLSHPDRDILGLAVTFVAALGLLFLPGVLRFFWKGGTFLPPAAPPGRPVPAD